MPKKQAGFYTGDIACPPYLTQAEVQEDCAAGIIADVYRKTEKANNIIHRRYVEGYYRGKGLPGLVIDEKLKSLGIIPAAQAMTMAGQTA